MRIHGDVSGYAVSYENDIEKAKHEIMEYTDNKVWEAHGSPEDENYFAYDCELYSSKHNAWHANKLFASEQEAKNYLKNAGIEQAVRFKYTETENEQNAFDTKELKTLILKTKKSYVKYMQAVIDSNVKNRKSKFIGCSHCGSKINIDYIHAYTVDTGFTVWYWKNSGKTYYCDVSGETAYKCPVCSSDLRSETALTRINNLKDKFNENVNNLIRARATIQKKLYDKSKKTEKTGWIAYYNIWI